MIKKSVLPKLMLLSLASLSRSIQSFPYIGSIINTQSVDVPGIYYKGFRIPTENQLGNPTVSFEIDEIRPLPKISLLFIAKPVKIAAKCKKKGKKIPSCLMVPEETEYKYLELAVVQTKRSDEKNPEKKDARMSWSIEEKQLEQTGLIPEDKTIIILLDPAWVQIKNITWSPHDNFIKLPTITIKTDEETTKNIKSALIRLEFASIEMNTIHEPITKKVRMRHNQHNLTITKISPNQCP